ncbi:putative methyltransferase DDB_G0268948 [Archocentrus centrarchus]|uniref:putative methyltransferase DDB_G0268948 n=1 Tax=Archocentrus centrarchus TaxID=63155 RepID=UPI0011E9F89F|nr:putative methyltransferase DDB_G0268948 [Archocentrus centrarchus]XP_030614535.1 putative methyltransferase DDB_G0268948 [Archocentrus centrarchus]XP_030614536.1 putative methyltransferase DDB_G0268948 [Archocentrus centrarchus]XP_030614537.1 putative methyltransferase DDB_G0268948 [Archocentrus centrarchus]XP_030614538.1 putative methyltransferase DDB_G0268948 [Archocentrus centrarchus]
MAYRLFEGKDHAGIYQKYRFTPPKGLMDVIIQYLDKKKGQPHELAVDLGCGTGQNSRLLAPHFKEVVGLDISEGQLEEARAVPGYSNITYRKGTAEELPFSDASVDLLTAASAAHWFDQPRFLAEASRVLKPGGCMALLGFSDHNTKLYYQDCGDRLKNIYEEMKQSLQPYTSNPVAVADNKLEELYSAIPFPDKERIDCFQAKSLISVSNLVGFIQTWSMVQAYTLKDPKGAEDLLFNTQKRFLEEMGVTSPDTEIEHELEYYCILASKPH